MPTHDASTLVNSTSVLPGPSEWSGRVTDLAANEMAPVSRDGVVHFSVHVSWRYDEHVPVKGFRVYVREEEDPVWDVGADALPGANNARVPGFYRAGVIYEFAVVAIGLNCCAHEGPSTAPRVALTYHGVELLPGPPTGLAVYERDGDLVAKWDPSPYPGEVQYEVRVGGGDNIETAVVVLRTRLVEVTLHDVPPSGVASADLVVSVIAVTGSGLRSSAAQVTVSSPPAAPSDDVVAIDLSSGGTWPGSSAGLTVSGTSLVIDEDTTEALYTTTSQDAGSIAQRQVLVLLDAELVNDALTWDTALFTWDGFEGQRRTWDLGGASVPAIPEVLDGRGGLTWDELEDTWDDYDWLTWSSYPERPEDADLTWDECGFTWDSAFASSLTWDGALASSGATITIRVRFSDDNSTWTSWAPYARQTATFRYWQAEIAVTRPSNAVGATISSARVFLVRRGGAARDQSLKSALQVTQASHGFSVGDAIYHTGSAYALAQSDLEATVGRFIVSEVDGNDFVAVVAGYVDGLSGLTAGTLYFVDESTAGKLRATSPPSGNWANPILLATSTTAGWVIPQLPTLVP